ncbi:hypothetical protein ACLB2K_002233 [Fragaria x ananassa]
MQSHSLEESTRLRTIPFGPREALDPTKELQNVRGYGLKWTSTRGETSCEAPSSDPQSRSVTIEELELLRRGRPPVKLHQVTLNHTRPFVCTIDDCRSTYRRRDHLNHRLLQHQGKLFKCPIENCKSEFAFQGNVKRHIVEFHSEDRPSTSVEGQKEHVCQEPGCGKVFQFASKLRKHDGSHGKNWKTRVVPYCRWRR